MPTKQKCGVAEKLNSCVLEMQLSISAGKPANLSPGFGCDLRRYFIDMWDRRIEENYWEYELMKQIWSTKHRPSERMENVK